MGDVGGGGFVSRGVNSVEAFRKSVLTITRSRAICGLYHT